MLSSFLVFTWKFWSWFSLESFKVTKSDEMNIRESDKSKQNNGKVKKGNVRRSKRKLEGQYIMTV